MCKVIKICIILILIYIQFYIQKCYHPDKSYINKEIITEAEIKNNLSNIQKVNNEISEQFLKDSKINNSNNNENERFEKDIKFSSLSNGNFLEDNIDVEKVIRCERKKTTLVEFDQIKIPTNNQEDYKKENNSIDNKNYVTVYSNSNNTKNTTNTIVNINLSNSLLKKNNYNNIKINFDNYIRNNKEQNKKYKFLDLEVIHSWNLPRGLKIHIKEGILENSLRKENDGKIYFGFQEDINNPKEKIFVDYLLIPKENEYDSKYIGKHFQIRYDEKECKFFLKDLGSGYGTFIKLYNSTKIKNNLLINVGETFIVFLINEEDEENNNNLILKIFTGKEQTKIYEFFPNKNNIIIIGRDKSNDVYIEDKMLSRKHCHIYLKNNENNKNEYIWFIKDGDINGKKSTNDTWLYSMEDNLIYDQMIFKTNNNMFKCNCY